MNVCFILLLNTARLLQRYSVFSILCRQPAPVKSTKLVRYCSATAWRDSTVVIEKVSLSLNFGLYYCAGISRLMWVPAARQLAH